MEELPTRGSTLPVSLALDGVSPITRLLEKKKEMLQLQELLETHKDEHSRQEAAFRRREDALRKKDLELQEALVLFNKFLKENEQKRRRAEQKTSEENKKADRWVCFYPSIFPSDSCLHLLAANRNREEGESLAPKAERISEEEGAVPTMSVFPVKALSLN